MSNRIKAIYKKGEKPLLADCGTPPDQCTKLPNGSLIANCDHEDLKRRARTALEHIGPHQDQKTRLLYTDSEWEAFTNHKRRLLGMGLADLVRKGLLPLRCMNPNQSGTKRYRKVPEIDHSRSPD